MEKRALTETEKIMLMKLLMGGAAAGGAAGLLTSYGNQVKTLKEKADEAVDDPYIEIPAPGMKMANATSPHTDKPPGLLALSLALPALGLPAIFSYAAARRAYQQTKKQELKKDLENSQEAYTEALSKEANTPRTGREILQDPEGRPLVDGDWWKMLAGGVIPLSTLAAAYMTNKVLDKSFPQAKKPQRKTLKIRKQAPQPAGDVHDSETAEESQDLEKEAAFYELDETDAVEFLVRTVLGNEKVAAESQLPKLLLRGSEDYNRTANTFMFRGVEEGFNHVKSASGSWADELDRAAGIHLMVKSASMGPTVALLAAAEFANAHPALCDQARQIDPRVGDELEKLAALNGAIARVIDVQSETEDFQKVAGDVREDIPLPRLSQLCLEKRAAAEVPTHDAINIAESRSSQVAKTENEQGDDPIPEATDDGDIVDQAMSELAGAAA